MKWLSGFGRLVKSVIGWVFLFVFGAAGVAALLDKTRVDFSLAGACLLLAFLGLLLVRSAQRDKKRREAWEEEEKQYRRQQEQALEERRVLQERERAQEESHTREERQDSVVWTAVECPGCGAVAQVRKGGTCRCEYCGGVLEGK